MYNNLIIILTYSIFGIILYLTILYGLGIKNIKRTLLYILPLVIIFDIPINYLNGSDKGFITLRLWNIYTIMIVILYFNNTINLIKRWHKALLIIYMFGLFQLFINSFDSTVLRADLKFIFSYFPLVLSIKIYFDEFNIEKIYRVLNLSGIINVILVTIQIIANRVGINLFIINLFNKPSGTFSEPIWLGVYMLFLILILDKKFKRYKIIYFIFLILSGSKAAIITLIIIYILTSKKYLYKILILFIGSYGIFIALQKNIYSISNIIDSFYIHISNWGIPLGVFLRCNILKVLFGVGPGNINSMALNADINQITYDLNIKTSIGITLNKLGGDVANLFVEILTSFGLIVFIIFIYFLIKFYINSANNIKVKRLIIGYLIVGFIHPLYYMGFGIFIFITILELFNRGIGDESRICST